MSKPRLADRLIWRLAPGPDSPPWIPRVVTAIWALSFAAGVFYALIQPVWSVVDEGPHFGYVELVAEHFELPKAGETAVSEEVLAIGRDRQWGWQYPRDPLLRLDGEYAPVGTGRADESEWVRQNLWRFNYEAIQPPFYYFSSALAYRLAPGGALERVYAIRMLSALFASLNVLIAYRIARRISPRSRILQIGAPASFILLQGYMLNLSQVTNDALAAPMGGLLILIMVTAVQEDVDRRRGMLIGLALGLAMLTKSVLWMMPIVMTAVFVRQFGLRGAIRRLKWIAAVSSAIFIPWLLRNFLVYGEATGQNTMSRFLGTFFPAPKLSGIREIWTYVWTATRHLLLSYAWGEPVWVWANQRANAIAIYVLAAVAMIGWITFARHRRRMRATDHHPATLGSPDPPKTWVAPLLERPGMWVCGLTVLVAYGFLMVLPLLGGIAVVGRYMYPVSAGVAVAVTFGAARAVPRPKLRVAFLVLIAAAFLALNVVNLVGWRETGLATSRVADGIAYSTGVRAPSTTWYFAAGRNAGGFTQNFNIFNPSPMHSTVTINYFVGGGTVSKRSVEVPGGETVTVNTRFDKAGGAGAGHLTMGAMIVADSPVVVERSAFFFVSDRGWDGGTITPGLRSLSTDGYFAAGRVGDGFSEVLSFLNPGDQAARVTIEYTADGRMSESTVVVPARSPARVDVAAGDAGALGEKAERLSARIRSSQPIAMERQLYYSAAGYAGGEWSAASMPASSWMFPTVQAGAGYHPTLIVLNPEGDQLEGVLRYRFSDGRVTDRNVRAQPGRTDIDLDVATGAGLGVVGAPYTLEAIFAGGVVAELETGVRDGGYIDVLAQPGVTESSPRWYFAAGSTHPDFAQRLTLFNPTDREVWVRLSYGPSRPAVLPTIHQPAVEKGVRLAPGEVLNIDVGLDALGVGAAQDLSTSVDADGPIFAARTLLFIHSF